MLAVLLGVGFVTGTLIFGDTAEAGYYETFARGARGADAVVRGPSAEQADRVRELPEVAEVDARIVADLPLLDGDGRPVTNFGRAGVGIPADGPPSLRPFDVAGALPTRPGEALLDKETAAHLKVAAGDRITVVDKAGRRHTYSVAGQMDFGVATAFSGSSVVGLPAAELTALTGVTTVQEVLVTAEPGVSTESLLAALRGIAGDRAVSGEQRRHDLADAATAVASQFTFILLVFGAISLVVAVFVIYNTFAILLAQRLRETALLRCVGANRRQLLGSILAESALVGLVGGLLGAAFGVAVAHVLPQALNSAFNSGIPMHRVVVGPLPLLAGIFLGAVATVAAAVLPAIRATRVSPMAALRDLPTAAVAKAERPLLRGGIAIVLTALGVAITVAGWRTPDSQAGTFIIAFGGTVVFLGVLAAAPLYVGQLTSIAGFPLRRNNTVRLAVLNARRNPGRAAVTTAALMVGVGLMALFSVLIASVERTASVQLDAQYPVDYVITPVRLENGPAQTIPATLAERLRAHAEFTAVVETRAVPGKVFGQDVTIGAVSNGGDGVLTAGTRVRSGENVRISLGGKDFELAVTGVTEAGVPGAGPVDLFVPWQRLAQMAGPGDDTTVMVKARDGVSAAESRGILDSLRDEYPLIEVSSVADLSDGLEAAIAGILGLFGGLLGMTVLIALFGIANTLSLSVVEPVREQALMRAIGLSRRQLRWTLLLEAILLGLVAGMVGTGLGILFGRIVVQKALSEIGATVVVPWFWLAGLLAAAGIASALAALLPARRAARTAIVASLTAE